jgi:adenine C2-methylase RlmN of 23S rRNA A2503 and tRNA A37
MNKKKKTEKKISERDFTKEVKDMAERISVKPKDKDVQPMFECIHHALNNVANLSGYTFSVEEGFDIGTVMHAMITSTLVHALIRTSPEWLKENLQFSLDNFADLEGIANQMLKNGDMTRGNVEDFADFLASIREDDNDRVVH